MNPQIRFVCVAALLTTIASPLRAAPNSDVDAAVTLARDAKQKYDRGDWAGARDLFLAAEGHAHSPVLLLYLARCQRNLSQWIDARSTYTRVVKESLAPDAPEPFAQARTDARSDLDALTQRIPKVLIDVSALPEGAALDLDHTRVLRERLVTPLEIDPGPHVVHAMQGDHEIAETTFKAEEGRSITIHLELAQTPREPDATPAKAVTSHAGTIAGATLLGLGAVGIGVGVVTRVLAFQKVSDVESRCQGNHCLPSDQSEITSAKALQIASSIGFVAGAVAASVGAILLIALPSHKGSPQASVRAGLSSIELRGTF